MPTVSKHAWSFQSIYSENIYCKSLLQVDCKIDIISLFHWTHMLLRSVVTVTSLVITYMARMWLYPLRDDAQLSKCLAGLLWWLWYGLESSNVGGLLRQELGSISQRVLGLVIQNLRTLSLLWFYSNDAARSQICTCHDSRAVVARAKLWTEFIIVC